MGNPREMDFGGNTIIVDGLRVGATAPGQAGTELTGTEITYLDALTPGTVTASKAVVVDANKDIATLRHITLSGNLVSGSTTLSEADLAKVDGITNGTAAASKALVLDSSSELNWTYSSSSTDGGTSVEPFNLDTTMTGIGGVGGRGKFTLTTNVALGSWSNALKAQTTYGASGRTTGLGSAFVAEMTLSAGTSSGTYAPLELELNLGSGALTGTASSLIYASVNGADSATFDTSGYLLNIAGVATAAEDKLWAAHTLSNVNEVTHGLRIKTPDGDFYVLAATAANFT